MRLVLFQRQIDILVCSDDVQLKLLMQRWLQLIIENVMHLLPVLIDELILAAIQIGSRGIITADWDVCTASAPICILLRFDLSYRSRIDCRRPDSLRTCLDLPKVLAIIVRQWFLKENTALTSDATFLALLRVIYFQSVCSLRLSCHECGWVFQCVVYKCGCRVQEVCHMRVYSIIALNCELEWSYAWWK